MTQIRRADSGDLAFIAALEKETFSLPQSENGFREMLHKSDHVLLVAEKDGCPCGYICAYTVCRESDILTVAVSQSARRCGIGRALVAGLIDALKEQSDALFLEVRKSNTPARALYASLGFSEIGVRRGYYQSPKEDAVLYKREI